MFALFHLPVTYTGKEIFTSIGRIQHTETKEPMCPGAFTLSSAHVEFLGLIVMARKILTGQVLLMDTPLPTLVKTENKFASDIFKEIFQIKSCHCPGDSFRKQGERVGSNQVLENQICGPHPVPSRVKEVTVEKREISNDSEYYL